MKYLAHSKMVAKMTINKNTLWRKKLYKIGTWGHYYFVNFAN